MSSKITATICFIFLNVTIINASNKKQEKIPFHFNLEAKGGATYTSVASDLAGVNVKYKGGFIGGLGMQLAVNPSFALQFDILFKQAGYSFQAGAMSGNLSLNYVELPLLYHVEISHFFIGFGPYLALLLSKSLSYSGVPSNSLIDDNFSNTDAGFIFEVGAIYYNVLFSARYSFGVADVSEGSFRVPASNVSNKGVALMAGYRLGLL